jgi:hypothetical protein
LLFEEIPAWTTALGACFIIFGGWIAFARKA